MIPESIDARLAAVVGERQLFVGDGIDARYRSNRRGQIISAPGFLVRPGSAEEVSAVLRLARELRISVTTQGGRTNTVGADVPEKGAIIISLERMTAIEDLDPLSMTLTIQAGATLQLAQETAEAAGLFLPLDLGSRGSATVGGVISTNAGGLRAIRWGLARDMVLGLEAVLADGTIVRGLKKTLKDNAGYDWKHLMIGSEGTLGIVTRATLRLRPIPKSTMTALLALADFDAVMRLLRELDVDLGGQLSSFEVMWNDFYRYVTVANRAKRPAPMAEDHPFYVLVEAMGGDPEGDPERFKTVLMAAIDRGLVRDAVIAQSGRERNDLWAVREDLLEPMTALLPAFGFDVSVALSEMARAAALVTDRLRAKFPDARIYTYGHAGDGNLHFVVSVGKGGADTEHQVDEAVYGGIRQIGGSISAEHGIGALKRDWLSYSRSEGEIRLMTMIKASLDPDNILNPGKVLKLESEAA
jgi:FAD/FMN-containing dehydrogenase